MGNTTITSQLLCVNATADTISRYDFYGSKLNCTLDDAEIPPVTTRLRRIASTGGSKNAALAPSVKQVPDNESPCIGRSFTYPNWRIYNFTDSDRGSVRFTLENRALLRQVHCQADEMQWIKCESVAENITTFVRVQPAPLEIFVNQTWFCDNTASGTTNPSVNPSQPT